MGPWGFTILTPIKSEAGRMNDLFLKQLFVFGVVFLWTFYKTYEQIAENVQSMWDEGSYCMTCFGL